jgi:hypothetical protein
VNHKGENIWPKPTRSLETKQITVTKVSSNLKSREEEWKKKEPAVI